MNEKACDRPQETPRGMGYLFEKPPQKGIIIRAPTPEERQAKDKHIESLREERGAEEALRVARAKRRAAYLARFADARVRAMEKFTKYAKTRR
jgi:hypothetical protein